LSAVVSSAAAELAAEREADRRAVPLEDQALALRHDRPEDCPAVSPEGGKVERGDDAEVLRARLAK
jgi:hypothetical protein